MFSGVLNKRQRGLAGALERRESSCRRQQLAQDNCSRHTNALRREVELREAVLTKRDEWNAAEITQGSVIKRSNGQVVGSNARDLVLADAVSAEKVQLFIGHCEHSWLCGLAAHLRLVRVVLGLMASASLLIPSAV